MPVPNAFATRLALASNCTRARGDCTMTNCCVPGFACYRRPGSAAERWLGRSRAQCLPESTSCGNPSTAGVEWFCPGYASWNPRDARIGPPRVSGPPRPRLATYLEPIQRDELHRLLRNKTECPIVYSLHCPKTGGNFLQKAVEEGKAFRFLAQRSLRDAYVWHGSFPMNWERFAVPEGPEAGSGGLFYTSEWPLVELSTVSNYPYMDRTCFISVVREPHAWAMSAFLHMTRDHVRGKRHTADLFTGPAGDARYAKLEADLRAMGGYFDAWNIQARHAALALGNSKVHTLPRLLVLATLERGAAELGSALQGDGSTPLPRANSCEERLGNTSPDAVNNTGGVGCDATARARAPLLARHVATHYSEDMNLWRLLSETPLGVATVRLNPDPLDPSLPP